MTKKMLSQCGLCFLLLIFLISGCDLLFNSSQTKSSSGSNSGTTTPTETTHDQVTYNILAKSPFDGQQLNSTFWSNLETYCKAGPTQLIIVDLDFIPSVMRQAGFPGTDNQLYYATASTYAGLNWSSGDDPESQYLSENRKQIEDMWDRYIQKIVKIMQSATKTTAIIITNDGADRCGSRLGNEIYKNMGAVSDRVQLGDAIP